MEESNNYHKNPTEPNIFNNFKDIEPTEAWEESLFERIKDIKQRNESAFSPRHYTTLIVFFVLINAFFIASILIKHPPQYSARELALKTISTELMLAERP